MVDVSKEILVQAEQRIKKSLKRVANKKFADEPRVRERGKERERLATLTHAELKPLLVH